jgi:hypothetical protein
VAFGFIMGCNKVLIIISAVFLLIFGIIGVSVYFGGYVPSYNESLNWVETNCTVEAYEEIAKNCSNQCNCVSSCSRSIQSREDVVVDHPIAHSDCSTICQTCYYTCYDDSIYFGFNPDPKIVDISSFQNLSISFGTMNSAGWINPLYPINGIVKCYYDICAFEPISTSAQLNCQKTSYIASTTNVSVIQITPNINEYNMAVASVAFVGFFALGIVIIGCIYCWNNYQINGFDAPNPNNIPMQYIDNSNMTSDPRFQYPQSTQQIYPQQNQMFYPQDQSIVDPQFQYNPDPRFQY